MTRTPLWTATFSACYLAVLPMAHTIALRNIAFLALLIILVWQFPKIKHDFKLGWLLLLWTAYLSFFPLFAEDHLTALRSLVSQWGKGLLAFFAGTGAAVLLYNKNKIAAFYLGLVSAIPNLIHLYLFVAKALTTSIIPWGYWGRETHHADLGYAAGQAVIFFAAVIATGPKTLRFWAFILIFACLLSTVLAHSRAGFAFVVLALMVVFVAVYIAYIPRLRVKFLASLLGVVAISTIIFTLAIQNDSRWRYMSSELVSGFYGDAIQLQCEGSSSIKSQIIANYGDQADRMISSIEDGDGSRMVLLRAGSSLALTHPWGLDGSRQSYQKLLIKECPNPVIRMSHTHNGWLDTVLALGWIGALLYFFVFLYFFKFGFFYLRRTNYIDEWALVLVALSAFWVLRGFTDSVFRDHMLEMQGFVLAYAISTLKMREKYQ